VACDSTSAYQISSESDYPWHSYDVTVIFKKAAVSHVGLAVWPLDHPWSVTDGPWFVLKCQFDQTDSVVDITIFYLLSVWHETAQSRPALGNCGAYFSHMTSPITVTPKRTLLTWKHVVWAIKHEIGPARRIEKTKERRVKKKSQRRYISSICGEAHY